MVVWNIFSFVLFNELVKVGYDFIIRDLRYSEFFIKFIIGLIFLVNVFIILFFAMFFNFLILNVRLLVLNFLMLFVNIVFYFLKFSFKGVNTENVMWWNIFLNFWIRWKFRCGILIICKFLNFFDFFFIVSVIERYREG